MSLYFGFALIFFGAYLSPLRYSWYLKRHVLFYRKPTESEAIKIRYLSFAIMLLGVAMVIFYKDADHMITWINLKYHLHIFE